MSWVSTISDKCIECNLCSKECRFLAKYGTPKAIADGFNPSDVGQQDMAFECSLCGLCSAVCPVDLEPAKMFLEMRRESVRRGGGDHPEHCVILNYENRGTSRLFTHYGLPRDCNTVFFPGCALPGSRPHQVERLHKFLKERIPSLGIVLDCCTKPSHDLGRESFFHSMFNEMKIYLLEKGVRNVLVACPNCYQVFKEHGGDLGVQTVYEVMAREGVYPPLPNSETVTIHDPCAVRFDKALHSTVRELVVQKGLKIEEMRHSGEKTLCCGEGGSVRFLLPELARNWQASRNGEAKGRRIVTYCAGCADMLGATALTSHVLDLVFEPEATFSGSVKISRAPFTCWNRLRLKNRFKKTIHAAVTRERTFALEEKSISGKGLCGMQRAIRILGDLVGMLNKPRRL